MTNAAQILIADGDGARARRISGACTARGYSVTTAPDGPCALEAALSDVPDVLVAPVDLRLIEAPQLANILRANPRTQGVRVLFLGAEGQVQLDQGFFDDLVPEDAETEDVALRIEAMLAQRERFDAVEREAEAAQEVQGRLQQIPLTDLLQLFHMNRRTGTIEVERVEPGGAEERGTLVLREGNLIQATTGRVEGEKALYRLLGWADGSFAFTPGRVTMEARIATPTRALLMEALRQLDEWDRVAESLPAVSGRARLAVPASQIPAAVHPLTQELLALLEEHEEIRDLLDQSRHPDYQVLRSLQTLVEQGWVRLLRDAGQDAEGTGAVFEGSAKRRLREWLAASRPRGTAPGDAKLLLASSDADATRDFVRLLAGLPGMKLAPSFQDGSFQEEDLAPIGRLRVDETLGIELVHVPVAPSYQPTWPALGQGALGTLLLMGRPGADPEAPLRPLIETLRGRQPARLFHVMLLPKGERLATEELQPHLSLLEDASLILLPVEDGRDAEGLLRAMFTRVLP